MRKPSLELRKKRFEKKIKRFLFWYFFPSILFSALFIFIFNINFLAIKEVKLNLKENNYLNKENILADIKNILNERYSSILSKRNYIFYPKNEIETYLLKKYPEINYIDIEWGDIFDNIVVSIDERKEKNVYCESLKADKCFSMSEDGKIFSALKSYKKDKKNIYFISKSNLKIGEKYFSSGIERDKIISLINFLKSKKILVKFFIKENLYNYKIILSSGTKVLLSSDFNEKYIILKINKISSKINFEKTVYIDLRLKNRISYCIQGDICENNF